MDDYNKELLAEIMRLSRHFNYLGVNLGSVCAAGLLSTELRLMQSQIQKMLHKWGEGS